MVALPSIVTTDSSLDDLDPAESLPILVGHLDEAELLDWEPIGVGRGVFSRVWRMRVRHADRELTWVAKIPSPENGDAARTSGACQREAWAYAAVLPHQGDDRSSPIAPVCHLVARDPEGGAAFILEDLSELRPGDQEQGATPADAAGVVASLVRFQQLVDLGQAEIGANVRRNAPASFDPGVLEAGLDRLPMFDAADLQPVFSALLARRRELVATFGSLPDPVLCHGDPRLDNVAFDADGSVVLYDFQQLAIQAGEADLAWLAATSLTRSQRQPLDDIIVGHYADAIGRPRDDVLVRYRLSFVLPGLAVLLLAQRQATPATTPLVERSLRRIGAALIDLEVADLAT